MSTFTVGYRHARITAQASYGFSLGAPAPRRGPPIGQKKNKSFIFISSKSKELVKRKKIFIFIDAK